MSKKDEISAINERHWEWAVKKGAGCTVPWLDLDPARLRQYAKGELEPIPKRLIGIMGVLSEMCVDVEGMDVLCLAAGGGQQSAVFGLLGARVTVLDLCEAQLKGDRTAAAHYGYGVTTIHADMRDLSCLDDETFHFVYGTGTCFVPDARQVYAGVARVLRPGGVFRVDFCNPAREFVNEESWDGGAYRITVPYHVKQVMGPAEDGGQPSVQFRHYMDEIFNGLLDFGFSIERVFDDGPREQLDPELTPGSWKHAVAFLPGGLAIVARKK